MFIFQWLIPININSLNENQSLLLSNWLIFFPPLSDQYLYLHKHSHLSHNFLYCLLLNQERNKKQFHNSYKSQKIALVCIIFLLWFLFLKALCPKEESDFFLPVILAFFPYFLIDVGNWWGFWGFIRVRLSTVISPSCSVK